MKIFLELMLNMKQIEFMWKLNIYLLSAVLHFGFKAAMLSWCKVQLSVSYRSKWISALFKDGCGGG